MPRRDSPQNLAEVYQDLRNDFRAADQTRFTPRMKGVRGTGSGADYHYRVESKYLRMVERARHFERNDPVVGQGITRLVANVMQQGFTPDPQTGDTDLDSALKEEFNAWANDADECHSEKELHFKQIEKLVLRSAIRDGDIFSFLRKDGSVQLVEGHRVRTPFNTKRNVVNGILLDDDAVRQEVWVAKEEIGTQTTVHRVKDVHRRRIRDEDGNKVILQTFFPDRSSQRRGITALAPCSDIVGMHDDLQFTTLVKAQMASLLVLLQERDGTAAGNGRGPNLGTQSGSGETQTDDNGFIKQISGLQAGLHVRPPKGETIKGFAPNIPNPEFFPHTMLLLTFVSINLDLPLQVLLLDPQKSSFSSWRGAIDQARVRYREIQSDYTKQWHVPIWKWRARRAYDASPAIRQMVDRNPRWLVHQWKPPSFPYIEPHKDAQADALQQDRFLSSPRRIHGRKGDEYEEIVAEIIADRKLLIVGALEATREINEKYEEANLSFRDFLSEDLGAKPRSPVNLDRQEENGEQPVNVPAGAE